MEINHDLALRIMQKSNILYNSEDIDNKIAEMAYNVNERIGHNETPLFLTVMNGGLFFAAELLKHITKPILCDYVHASRYINDNLGDAHITWQRQPSSRLIKDRHIYIIDDILDEGHTLFEIVRFLHELGAASCKIIVLLDKDIGKIKPISADVVGFTVPNYYVFGFGMDVYGLYRQLPNIYQYHDYKTGS